MVFFNVKLNITSKERKTWEIGLESYNEAYKD